MDDLDALLAQRSNSAGVAPSDPLADLLTARAKGGDAYSMPVNPYSAQEQAAHAKDPRVEISGVSSPMPAVPVERGIAGDVWDGTKNLGLGLAKGLMAIPDGAAQLLTKGLASGAETLAPQSQAAKFLRGEADRVAAINQDREDKYQAMTPGSIAAGVGNVVGQVVVPVPLLGGATKAATVAGRIGKAAATGGALSALQPVYGDQSEFGTEKGKQVALGAALGGGLSGLGAALGGVKNAAAPLINPGKVVGDITKSGLDKAAESQVAAGNVGNLMGSNRPDIVLQRLQQAQQIVPGSTPTTAQVAGVPELVMAEKTLQNNPAYKGAFMDRAIQNNQARNQALASVARTPEDLAAAQIVRKDVTAPLYEAARGSTYPVNDQLAEILKRPSAQQAVSRGRKLAAERGEDAGITAADDAAAPVSNILDASGKPFAADAPPIPGTITGRALQYLKMGQSDLLDTAKAQLGPTGMDSHETRALANTGADLKKWIQTNSPEYANADREFQRLSVPVNTMETAQGLQQTLSGGAFNAAGEVAPGHAQFRTQLAKVLKKQDYGIDPEAQAKLQAIERDLQRETVSNSIRSSGSDTAFNLQAPGWLANKLYGAEMDGNGAVGQGLGVLGGFLTGGGPIGAYGGKMAAKQLGAFAGQRVDAEFQKAMLDPQHMAKLIAEALKRDAAGPSSAARATPGAASAASGQYSRQKADN